MEVCKTMTQLDKNTNKMENIANRDETGKGGSWIWCPCRMCSHGGSRDDIISVSSAYSPD